MARQTTRALLLLGLIVLAAGCAPKQERKALKEFRDRQQEIDRGSIETSTGQRPAVELPAEPTLDNYLAYAAKYNPQLRAAFKQYEAALRAVVPARTLPDPEFSYQYSIATVEPWIPIQRQGFSLSQTFPWFGKLQLQGDIALENAKAQGQAFEAAKLSLFYQVKDAYYEYYYVARAIAITKGSVQLLGYLEQVARTKYAVATADYQDVIRAQVEQGKIENELRTLQDLRNPLMAKLNSALNRPADAELSWPSEPLQEEQMQASNEQVLTWLRQANPQLKVLDHQIAAEKQSIELAGKDYFPDLTLGVEYMDNRRSVMPVMPDNAGVMIAANLPIWREKYRQNERQARARYQAALSERLGTENSLAADVHMALYEFRNASRKINLYRDSLLPKAQQSLKVIEAAYRADKADFLDLIDAQRVLLEFQLSYERALADRAKRLAELEMLIGQPLPRTKVQNQQSQDKSEKMEAPEEYRLP